MSNLSKLFSGILDEIDNSLGRSVDNRISSSVRYSPLGYRNVSQPYTRLQGQGMRPQGQDMFGNRQTYYSGSQTPGYGNNTAEGDMHSGSAGRSEEAMRDARTAGRAGRAGGAGGSGRSRLSGKLETGKGAGGTSSELRSKVEEKQMKQRGKTGFNLDLSNTSLLNAIVLGEVLGKPKCFGKGR